jgi:hypothetical protein
MRRVISPTSFILKGSGWYVTDYPSRERERGLAGEKPPAVQKETKAEKEPVAPKESSPAPKAQTPAARPEKKSGRRKSGPV